MTDVKNELMHVRKLLGVLVRRERYAETKAEIATRRLDRMEREQHEADDAEHEANLQQALLNQSKAVRVLVDKWFVDKGYGFGRATTGEIVFIHASAVQGAEVLTIGTEAWVQVVNDDARAQGGGIEHEEHGDETRGRPRGTENANRAAQQVRRAAVLTAELAAQSEKKTAAVCDQPPGLDELAGHIEAPNMGAGGSHPQAPMMPDPWATYKRPSTDEGQTTVSAPPETNRCAAADRGVFAPTRGSRGARPRSAARASSTHLRNPNLMGGEVQPRKPTEQELRLRHKKEEAWELFHRESRNTREEFKRSSGKRYWAGKTTTAKTSKRKTCRNG